MTHNTPQPPRIADWLLRHCLPEGHVGESIRGDLYEEYKRLAPTAFRQFWYIRQAIAVSGRYAMRQTLPKQSKASKRSGMLAALARDLRHSVRRWRKRPAFTVLTVATLGLGIGATTAMFSVVDRVLLRALPYPAPHELVTVWNTYPTWRGHEVLNRLWDVIALSYPEYIDWREGQTAFQSVAIYSTGLSTLTGLGDPALIGFGRASSSLFAMLGAQPVLGRTFRFEEEGDGGAKVVVVSHGFWVRRLGGDVNAIGRLVTVDDEQYTVIGVLPPGFRLRSLVNTSRRETEVWVPAGIFGDAHDRGSHGYEAMARIQPATTLNQAAADAGPLLRGERSAESQNLRILWRHDAEVASSSGPLLLLLGAASMLMLIAGVNTAMLLTAETTGRRHELATRGAVGASRRRLVSQLVTESVAVGLLGAALGVIIAFFGTQLLVHLAPVDLVLPERIPIEPRVLVFCGTLGVVIGIIFGVGPALIATRGDARSLLTSRTTAGHLVTTRVQRSMVAAESGLCVVLLVLATLLTRSLLATQAVDPGFRRDNIVAVHLPVSGPRTQDAQLTQFTRQLIDHTASVPGVTGVTGTSIAPFSGQGWSSSFEIEGRVILEDAKNPEAHRRSVLPGFHAILGVPVLAGRSLSAMDVETANRVVVVSEALARQYWPGSSPIGSFILRDAKRWEIVGVVGDVLHEGLTEEPQSTFYFSFFQEPPTQFWLIVQSNLEVTALVSMVRFAVSEVAPEVAVGTVERLDTFVRRSTAGARYRMTLVTAFGGCSLFLAAIGMFGLTARMVVSRRRELGIRLALGASTRDVARAVVRQETSAMIFGVAAGLVTAVLLVRSISTFLYAVSPYDITSFLVAGLVLSSAGWAASYIPARRIALVDPAEVLHLE